MRVTANQASRLYDGLPRGAGLDCIVVDEDVVEAFKKAQKDGLTMDAIMGSGLLLVRADVFAHDHEGFADVQTLAHPHDEREGDRDEVLIRLEDGAQLERSKILARYALNDGRLLLDTARLEQLAAQARVGGVSR